MMLVKTLMINYLLLVITGPLIGKKVTKTEVQCCINDDTQKGTTQTQAQVTIFIRSSTIRYRGRPVRDRH